VDEVFNIGTANQTTILELARKVKQLTRSRSPIKLVSYVDAYPEGGFEDIQSRTPCICKIRTFTGWLPKTSLDEVILATAGQLREAAPLAVISSAGSEMQAVGVRNRP
jgi:UDP-glucose 4-epimerase